MTTKTNNFNNNYKDVLNANEVNIAKTFRATSLDSLANSSHPSDSEDSHDSDIGNKVNKDTFIVKCEVYAENTCGSIRSWTKSDSSNSEHSYDYNSSGEYNEKKSNEKRLDIVSGRMETIPEENLEPKVSVKEILARFENLKANDRKDCNNNNNTNNDNTNGHMTPNNCQANRKSEYTEAKEASHLTNLTDSK